MLTHEQIRTRYLIHTFLHKFTQRLFFAFGVLLIFAKTQSVLGTLVTIVIADTASLLMKSVGFSLVANLVRKRGVMGSMTIGLVLKAATLCGIFYLVPGHEYFYVLLIGLSVLGSIGNTPYVFGASALTFSVIGSSKRPGRESAVISILQTMSGLAATGMGAFLGFHGAFTYSFLIGGAILLISTIPLRGFPTPVLPRISFLTNLKKIPKGMFFANINPDHEVKVTAVPLIILLLSASLTTSIWISAVIAVATMFLSYGSGWVRDHHGAWLTWLALGVGIAAWGMYGFVDTPLGFLLPGILIGLAMEVLSVGREARMSTELAQSDNLFEGTMIIECARAIGILIGSAGILALYLVFHGLPTVMLVVTGIFLIPMAIYASGKTWKHREPTVSGLAMHTHP